MSDITSKILASVSEEDQSEAQEQKVAIKKAVIVIQYEDGMTSVEDAKDFVGAKEISSSADMETILLKASKDIDFVKTASIMQGLTEDVGDKVYESIFKFFGAMKKNSEESSKVANPTGEVKIEK